jgi:hypothetical protein
MIIRLFVQMKSFVDRPLALIISPIGFENFKIINWSLGYNAKR